MTKRTCAYSKPGPSAAVATVACALPGSSHFWIIASLSLIRAGIGCKRRATKYFGQFGYHVFCPAVNDHLHTAVAEERWMFVPVRTNKSSRALHETVWTVLPPDHVADIRSIR